MFGSSRNPVTTMPCKSRQDKVAIHRTCHQVRLRCPSCGVMYELQDYLEQMDEVLEHYLESVYCDRV